MGELIRLFPDLKYHVIGHSAGRQLVGLMSNSDSITSIFNFASSSGRTANMKFPFYLRARFFMDVFIPLNNFIFGYTNSQWAGMGEPLPKMVAKQWAQWCKGRGYVKTAFGKSIKSHKYDSLDFPSIWINAADGEIAIDENVNDMLEAFTKPKAEALTLDPKTYGLKEIGPMKFFGSWHSNG